MDITIDKKRDYWQVTCAGTFSFEGYQKLVESLLGEAGWGPGTHMMFDYLNTDLQAGHYELLLRCRAVHESNEQAIGNGKTALVMPGTLGYGVGRMWQELMDETCATTIQIFADHDGAHAWLTA